MSQEKIFFSYSRVDSSDFALRLYSDLQKAGADVWIDQKNIQPGLRWDAEIGKALEICSSVVFVVSEKSVASDNVLDEIYYAIDKKKQVLPVVYASRSIPYRLHRLQQINFIHDYQKGFQQLCEVLHLGKTSKKLYSL